jgi:hypothetical protein
MPKRRRKKGDPAVVESLEEQMAEIEKVMHKLVDEGLLPPETIQTVSDELAQIAKDIDRLSKTSPELIHRAALGDAVRAASEARKRSKMNGHASPQQES